MNLEPSRTSTGLRMRSTRACGAAACDRRADGVDVGLRGAVEDGNLKVVDLDDQVVDAEADQRGEQVLGGGDEHALAHQRGGVADLGDVAAGGGDLEVVEVRAAEDDAGAGGSGNESERNLGAGVKADAAERERRLDGVLELEFRAQKACYSGVPTCPEYTRTGLTSVSYLPQYGFSNTAVLPAVTLDLAKQSEFPLRR